VSDIKVAIFDRLTLRACGGQLDKGGNRMFSSFFYAIGPTLNRLESISPGHAPNLINSELNNNDYDFHITAKAGFDNY
jgi:hypothetical protein